MYLEGEKTSMMEQVIYFLSHIGNTRKFIAYITPNYKVKVQYCVCFEIGRNKREIKK